MIERKAMPVSSLSRATLSRKLKLGQLMVFERVLELGSFVRAANETGLTQSAVSKAIYELEVFFGEELFLRNNRGVQATDFGILLGKRAKSLIAELRYMTEEVNAFRTGEAGHVIVGTLISAAAELLPRAISLLVDSFPSIQITIREGIPPHLFPALAAGDIDVMVGRLPSGEYGFSKAHPVHHEVLYTESFCLVVGRQNSLAQCDNLQLSDLLLHQWIFPPKESTSRKSAEAMFSSAGLPVPPFRVESLSLLSNLGLLVQTNMVAFMPRAVASQFVRHGLISVLSFPGSSEFGDVGFSVRADKEITPACAHFIRCLRQAVTHSEV
jgi:DNA-binding transcriptional LysR family regulator